MKRLRRKVAEHLQGANKTYSQHLVGATKTGMECLFAGAAAIIHGMFPVLFEKTASDMIRKIYQRQNPTR